MFPQTGNMDMGDVAPPAQAQTMTIPSMKDPNVAMRQKMLADRLRQPAGAGQMVGGHFVPTSGLEHAATLLGSYGAGKLGQV